MITAVRLEANPHNCLAAVAVFSARNGREAFAVVSEGTRHIGETPRVPVSGDSVRLDIVGLRPERTYAISVIVQSASGERSESSPQTFTTRPLPDDLPNLTLLHSSSPSPGLVMFGITIAAPSTKTYALVVDNEGSIVWYRKFDGPVADFQKQPHGMYTVHSSLGGAPSHFYELDRGGNVLRQIRAAGQNETGPHELRITGPDYYLFGIELRLMDLSSLGGVPNASVRGVTVERHTGTAPVFVWRTFDHFDVSDAAPDISLTGPTVNPWHGNAIEIDTDGNLLVSFRNCDEVTKIETATGKILWRLGGKNNQFTFRNDPLNGFSHQHGIRRLESGNILLFDNGNLHDPPVSRAVEYALDESAKTATLVWEYRGGPELYSFALGFAQRLRNGNTLICFGIAQRIIEVDAAGSRRWELAISEPGHYAYRAFRIETLY